MIKITLPSGATHILTTLEDGIPPPTDALAQPPPGNRTMADHS
jgi:hypothetical protein